MAERIKYVLNGQTVSADEFAALPNRLDLQEATPPGAPNPALWPMESEGFGVLPSQVPEAIEHARKHGVPLEFTKDGAAIFRSQQHQREVLRKYHALNKADYLG